MANPKVIVGMDVGSSHIRTVVGMVEEKNNTINIIGVGTSTSQGIRKGAVTDMDEAVANITTALEDAERMSGEPIHRVYVGMSGTHIETYNSKGVIAISGQNAEITEDDVDRVLEAARAVSLPSNREILKIIPKSFSVDSQSGIKYPVGMTGIRLEVEAHIIAGHTAQIKNLEKCLYQTGIDTEEIVPSALSCAEAVLTKRQKELGCVLIEIGACCTNVAVFEEGAVIYSTILPVGGEHVTNDIAIGTRSAVETAEKIKLEFGSALPDTINDREQISLAEISKTDSHAVERKHVAKIIEARYHEIFMLVRDELARIGRDGMLPAGAILCGGGVKMTGVLELSRTTLQLPAQIGKPKDIEGIIERIDDPAFANVIGLIHFGNRYGSSSSILGFQLGDMFGSITSFFKRFLP